MPPLTGRVAAAAAEEDEPMDSLIVALVFVVVTGAVYLVLRRIIGNAP